MYDHKLPVNSTKIDVKTDLTFSSRFSFTYPYPPNHKITRSNEKMVNYGKILISKFLGDMTNSSMTKL